MQVDSNINGITERASKYSILSHYKNRDAWTWWSDSDSETNVIRTLNDAFRKRQTSDAFEHELAIVINWETREIRFFGPVSPPINNFEEIKPS